MYQALKKAGITAIYEGQTFELVESFDFPFESYERCANGKGAYKNRGNKKILNMKYTPEALFDRVYSESNWRTQKKI